MSEAATSPPAAQNRSGKYDSARRRRAKRAGRERGCWLYVPAEELAKTGTDLGGAAPFYRLWGAARGRLVVQFYRDGP